MTALLEYAAVGKVFPAVVALQDVSFSVAGSEVRALMGENGAGKSTLLKILAGDYAPDSGSLRVNGVARVFKSPRESQAAGIAIIHQELHLAPELSVTENLLLGRMPARSGFIQRGAARATVRRLIERLGEDVDPDAKVRTLPIGKRQMIEIGKALLRDAHVIAFDEPTSSLSARETSTLMRIIRDLRSEGRVILYVSHRMEEVLEISDTVTVLRDGRHVADFLNKALLTQDALISAMSGRTITDIYDYRARPLGSVSVEIEALEGPGLREPITLEVRQGEILGFFGLVGAGRSELFRLIYGATTPIGGQVRIHGQALSSADPREAIAAGLALCPEDRKDEGIVPRAAVTENIAIARRNIKNKASLFVDFRTEASRSAQLISLMRVKTPSPATAIGTLSGGNQQKVIIARWLNADAQILLMDEPTRGIDVAARSEIYGHMYRLAEMGKTILFASSDIPEVMGVADRIVVMREGRIAAIMERAAATPDRLLRLALPDGRGGSA
jgi:L-arabinose transport system ATP-binding protein